MAQDVDPNADFPPIWRGNQPSTFTGWATTGNPGYNVIAHTHQPAVYSSASSVIQPT